MPVLFLKKDKISDCMMTKFVFVFVYPCQTLGFILLGGVEVHALNVTGLIINTAGGVWYSCAKFQQKKNKQAKLLPDLEAHKK